MIQDLYYAQIVQGIYVHWYNTTWIFSEYFFAHKMPIYCYVMFVTEKKKYIIEKIIAGHVYDGLVLSVTTYRLVS